MKIQETATFMIAIEDIKNGIPPRYYDVADELEINIKFDTDLQDLIERQKNLGEFTILTAQISSLEAQLVASRRKIEALEKDNKSTLSIKDVQQDAYFRFMLANENLLISLSTEDDYLWCSLLESLKSGALPKDPKIGIIKLVQLMSGEDLQACKDFVDKLYTHL